METIVCLTFICVLIRGGGTEHLSPYDDPFPLSCVVSIIFIAIGKKWVDTLADSLLQAPVTYQQGRGRKTDDLRARAISNDHNLQFCRRSIKTEKNTGISAAKCVS